MKFKVFNVWFINRHALTESKDDDTKNGFYIQLGRISDGLSSD